MKHYNLEHEVNISSNLKLTTENPVESEDAEYNRVVDGLSFYQRVENNSIAKVYISKDFIVDLYNQIQDIEKEVETKKYYGNLPF